MSGIDDILDLPWEGRAVLLLDLDAFFASVEQLDHPDWRGKPVIVGGSAQARGVVSTCSYEARAFGVRSAMPASTAARLCPQAIWTPGRYARYREMSGRVMGIMRDESPLLQQVSVDEAFLDVTPTRANRTSPVVVARRIQARVGELGITCSIGVGTSKAVAKTASEQDKPRGLTVVPPGQEAAFLAPLPTRRMSGIGPRAQEELRKFGIVTLGDVAAAPDDVLQRVFGKAAGTMRLRCLGADRDPVDALGEPAKSVGCELSFARDLERREDIEAAISTVAAKVARRLRRKALCGRTLSLKVRFGDRTVRSAQAPLERPTNDEYDMMPRLYELLDRVWQPGMSVRLVGCTASGFDDADEPVQPTLFGVGGQGELPLDPGNADAPSGRAGLTVQQVQRDRQARASSQLRSATDLVRDRFGEQALQFGRELRTRQNLTGSGSKNPEDYRS